jgi:hypothetical protein
MWLTNRHCDPDDIFAAVDAYVAYTMFTKGVLGLLKGKSIIFAFNSHYDYLNLLHTNHRLGLVQ